MYIVRTFLGEFGTGREGWLDLATYLDGLMDIFRGEGKGGGGIRGGNRECLFVTKISIFPHPPYQTRPIYQKLLVHFLVAGRSITIILLM